MAKSCKTKYDIWKKSTAAKKLLNENSCFSLELVRKVLVWILLNNVALSSVHWRFINTNFPGFSTNSDSLMDGVSVGVSKRNFRLSSSNCLKVSTVPTSNCVLSVLQSEISKEKKMQKKVKAKFIKWELNLTL